AIDVKTVQFMPDFKKLLAEFKSEDRQLTLAARISGPIKTAFPDGNPAKAGEKKEGQPPDPAHLTENKDAAIIVVADCDMLTDQFWVREMKLGGNISLGFQKWADNGDFVFQMVDNLSGSSDLMSLRARGKFARPFDRVEQIQRDAEKNFLNKEQNLRT